MSEQNFLKFEVISVDSVRSGAYFQEGRRYYIARYARIASERSWALVAALAATVAFFLVLVSFAVILPVRDHIPIVLAVDEIERYTYQPKRLSNASNLPFDQVMRDFFVREYVLRREAYDPSNQAVSQAFVLAHSTEETAKNYHALFGVENPRSLQNILGTRGERRITITNFAIDNKGREPIATVMFEAEIIAQTVLPKTRWTARLQFQYTPAELHFSDDAPVQIMHPTFKVTGYDIAQAR